MQLPRFVSRGLVVGSALLAASQGLAGATGCARHEPVTPSACTFARGPGINDGHDPGVAGPMKAVGDDGAPSATARKLFDEARRELSVMRATTYRHDTMVDEESGTFEFDCSGFVSYALRIAAPSALDVIPVGVKGRPRAEDYVAYFSALPSVKDITDTKAIKGAQPWATVTRALDVREGDVIAWLRPADVDNTNTGHMGIVAAAPTACGGSDVASSIGGSAEWLVRIVDSTQSPHADDVRKKDESTGLGEGTIGIIVDATGAPVGYRWKGGVSDKAHATQIVIARLR